MVVKEDSGDVISVPSLRVTSNYQFDFMSKTGVHIGDGIVNWEVIINGNGMDYDYSGVTLTDVFASATELELDLDSIRLERYTPPKSSNGGHIKLEDIDLDPEHVSYDAESNTFQFTFPQDTNGKYTYKLCYATYTDMSQTGRVQIQNNATLGAPYSQSRSATVTFDATGAATSGIPYLRAGLTLEKTDEDRAPIAGVEFVLHNRYDIEVSRGTTNADGLLTFATARGKPYPLTYNMPYYLEELPREGYITPQGMLEIQILGNRDSASFEAQGDVSWFSTDAGGDPIDIAYTIDTFGYVRPVLVNKALAHVRLVKTSIASNPLPGVTFEIRDSGDALLATESTNSSGYIDFQDHNGLNMLRGSSYILREVLAPEGYKAYPEDIELHIAADGTVSVENSDIEVRFNDADQMWEFVVKNTQVGVPFAFRKVPAEDMERPLHGAEFSIYRCENTDALHTHEGVAGPAAADCWQEYAQVVSGENGMVDFGILPNGEYQLVETFIPNSYALPVGQWLIVLDIAAEEPVEITGIPVDGELPPAFFIIAAGETSELGLPNYLRIDLPVTGGTGTAMLRFAGVGLVLLGGLLGVWQRRRRKERNS